MTREQWYWNVHRPQMVRNYAMAMGIGAGGVEGDVQPDPMIDQPLTLTALQNGSRLGVARVNVSSSSASEPTISLEYKKNNGPWTLWDFSGLSPSYQSGHYQTNKDILLDEGDVLQLRSGSGGNDSFADVDPDNVNILNMLIGNGNLKISGNIMSTLSQQFRSLSTVPEFCFKYIFGGKKVSSIYLNYNVFTQAEDLVLPATTLADECYYGMFSICTTLTKAPKTLSAKVLKRGCYQNMFYNCQQLQSAPVISAETSEVQCCQNMFTECSSLSSIEVHFPQWTESATVNWMYNVANVGVFRCPTSLSVIHDADHIPPGWTVENF